ncbi:MAG: hypothetical protein WAW70_08495 [Streptococcus parauberis]
MRVNKSEYELITELAKANELSVSEYIRKRALGGEIIQPKMSKSAMQEVIKILARIEGENGKQGNNINQIARYLRLKAHESDFTPEDELEYAIKKINALESDFGAFREDVSLIWQLLGK